MAISQYWVGQIPARPITIDVRDSNGRAIALAPYTSFRVIVLGSDNESVDLTGSTLTWNTSGRFVFRWPSDRSIFEEAGDYLLQLEFIGPGSRDFTTEHNIKVRKLGGIK